ncbi:MAG: ThuA domain-containing protein, partial [Xanthomonadales bacterium]|nr:ThuA domain-containing protein [Xanthomonadales bacterium]
MRRTGSALALLLAACTCAAEPRAVVVLIGGEGRAGAPQHDHAAGIAKLGDLLEADPAVRDRVVVRAFPAGWPADPAALRDAATIVWYFEGGERHPLRDPVRRAAFEAALRNGAGVVALHQSSTVPPGDDLGLRGVLGAVRVGLRDRTTQWTTVEAVAPGHALLRGLPATFAYRDEFYPTFDVVESGGVRTPLLSATLSPQYRDGEWLVEDRAETVAVGWTFEAAAGTRALTYTGMHFDAAFGQPALRTLLRNAVLWTAKRDVPLSPAP